MRIVAGQEPLAEEPDSRHVVAALRDAVAHRLASSVSPGAYFAFDRSLRYHSTGRFGLADGALAPTLLQGRTIFEVFPAETVDAIQPLYRAALQGRSTVSDVPYEGRTYNQRLAPLTDASGVVIGGFGFAQDVTDTRAAEQALRESELQNRLTFDHAPIGKAIVELDGTWRRVNAALCELTGYTEEQLLQMTFQDITHPDDLDLDLDYLGKLIGGRVKSYRVEKRYITASGDIVWVLLSVALVRGPGGDPLYLISQIVDITTTKRQYQALQDLTAMVAHDLRSPAAVVQGFAELLEGPASQDPQTVRDYAARITASAEAMMVLADNALSTTAITGGHMIPHPTTVALRDAVKAAVRASNVGSTTVDTASLEDVKVYVDPVHLGQILANLVTNAAKYGHGQISVACVSSNDRVQVSVSDNGPGVEADFVPHLFERYSRSAAARAGRHRGTGLGLHIVWDLLAANNGHIEYTGSATTGACFVIELPEARPRLDVDRRANSEP